MGKLRLDAYEKELLESYENDEWESVKDRDEKIKEYRQYAANTLKKDKRINIRISSKDLEDIQRKAVEEGLPYQSLIASIIHKYNTGKLVEEEVRKK
jgi:predicted DNA binding CopG/RHH family protein